MVFNFKVFQNFSPPYTIINFFASLTLLSNFTNEYWYPTQNSRLCDWPMFSSAVLSLAAGKKCARFNLSQAASGIVLQNHRRLPVSIFCVKITAVGSFKRVTGRIFKISKWFQRSKVKLWFWFFHQLIIKKYKNYQRMYEVPLNRLDRTTKRYVREGFHKCKVLG